jgi:hypothetical protein
MHSNERKEASDACATTALAAAHVVRNAGKVNVIRTLRQWLFGQHTTTMTATTCSSSYASVANTCTGDSKVQGAEVPQWCAHTARWLSGSRS